MTTKIWHRTEIVALAGAIYLVAVLNVAFWQRLLAAVAPSTLHDWAFLTAVAVALVAVAYAVLVLLALPYIFKPVVAAVLIVCAGATYFMLEYGTLIDDNMIRNVLETDAGETHDLISLSWWRLSPFWALRRRRFCGAGRLPSGRCYVGRLGGWEWQA